MLTKPLLKISHSSESKTKKKRNLPPHQCVMTNPSLLDDLGNAKKDIDTILFHLNYQTDPDLIDSYCYQLKGAYMRYRFFLRQVQQTHI